MSAASQIVVVLASLGAAASLARWSEDFKKTGKPDVLLKEAMMAKSPPAPRSAPERDTELVPPEATVLVTKQHPVRRSVALTRQPAPVDREGIARQLQRELKRVGCYAGPLHGLWTTSARRAMREFTGHVNAMLPTDKPDIILLALVQAHRERVCGVPCPAGQDLSSTGQCGPSAILARLGGSKLATLRNQPSTPENSARTKITAIEAPRLPPGHSDHGVVSSIVAPTPPVTTAPPKAHPPRRVVEKPRQPSVKRERGWAYNLFRQRDRFSFN
jgi:hypothetical protein